MQQRNEMLSPLYTVYAVNSFKFIVEATGDVFETRCMSTFSSEEQKIRMGTNIALVRALPLHYI